MTQLKSFQDLPVFCPYCKGEAQLVKGIEIYGRRRPDLVDLNFWMCRVDQAWVGCHRGTTKPLGRLADAELRKAKQAAHQAFDPIWQHGPFPRGEAYGWLSVQLGIPKADCHIGEFHVEMCQKVVTACAKLRAAVASPFGTPSAEDSMNP